MADLQTSIALDVVAERNAALLAEYLRALQDCGVSNREIVERLKTRAATSAEKQTAQR